MNKIFYVIVFSLFLSACKNKFGDKVSQDYLEVYYKDGITKEQAKKTLDYFFPLWKEKDGVNSTKSIQLMKTGDTVTFRMVAKSDVTDKMDPQLFYETGSEISTALFDGTPVNVVLTDNKFKPQKTYRFQKDAAPAYGKKVENGNIEVYYKEGIDTDVAEKLAAYLNDYMKAENRTSFQLLKNEKNELLLRMASDKEKVAAIADENFYQVAKDVATNVFKGAPLIFELSDIQFEGYKKINYNNAEDKFAK